MSTTTFYSPIDGEIDITAEQAEHLAELAAALREHADEQIGGQLFQGPDRCCALGAAVRYTDLPLTESEVDDGGLSRQQDDVFREYFGFMSEGLVNLNDSWYQGQIAHSFTEIADMLDERSLDGRNE